MPKKPSSSPADVAQKIADKIIGDSADMHSAVRFLDILVLELAHHSSQWRDMLRRRSMSPLPELPMDGEDLF